MFDILTCAAIVDELADEILDGRIQRIGLRDAETLAFEVYASGSRHNLLATTGEPEPALFLSQSKFAADAILVTPFALLLRKYLRGGTIVAIEQAPLDRVVRLSIAKRFWPHKRSGKDSAVAMSPDADDGELVPEDAETGFPKPKFTHLYLEFMGRRSNFILVSDEGVVLDSLKRVNSRMSRVRPILPTLRYEPPPPQNRIDPRTLTAVQLRALMQAGEGEIDVATMLVRDLSAVSPQIAQEIVHRALGESRRSAKDLNGSALKDLARTANNLAALLESERWEPTVYADNQGDNVAYSAVPFHSLSARFAAMPVNSISTAIESCRSGLVRTSGKHEGRRGRLEEQIQQQIKQLESRVRAIMIQRDAVLEADQKRRWGEAIFAHLWEIQPGQPEVEIAGEVIPLDPHRSAKDVANDYFAAYRRMQRGQISVEENLASARLELEYLRQLETMVGLAGRFDEIEGIAGKWDEYRAAHFGHEGIRSGKSRKPRRDAPLIDPDQNLVYIGKNGKQNERISFEIAGPDDFWLHARGVPGAHVILRGPSIAPSDKALRRAASIAAWYSAARSNTQVEVDICQRKNVRKIKGAGPGMVTYRNERTILVSPHDETILGSQSGK